MTINQISVFLENKYGRLNEIFAILGEENIRIVAASVADTSDYGILRLITTDQQRAMRTLAAHNVSANTNEVFAIQIAPNLGEFAKTIELFTKAGITILYMYCFSTNQKGVLVLRANNLDAARDVVRKNSLSFLLESDLLNI